MPIYYMSAGQAIVKSTQEDSIVHIHGTRASIDDLRQWCDDYVEGLDQEEYWGTHEDGTTWRVHAHVESNA